ncbi:disease resistance protein RUN1-like [Telopea speciosissima]|uniref:disease resistance protein RUN1-like n=1 Tax=Telopea speciosissima TaxID=54955 RepID=UPI001CC60A5E|nr:disease resistance protein RUN1-like [Telopea speciosissima]
MWEACGFEPRYRLEVLKRKYLLKISEKNAGLGLLMKKSKFLSMHDQIRDMGRRIADNQSPTEPGKHSRLWPRDNIMKVLHGSKGNEIVGDLPLWFGHIVLNIKSFENMSNLRLLEVDGAVLLGKFQYLPSMLRWLSWCYCPLEKLSADFYHDKIVMLDLSFGIFKLDSNNWLENKMFQQLKILKLSSCWKLFESPDFSGFPLLERLYLNCCPFLVNIHESIGQLQQLVYLNLDSCIDLKKLPNSISRLSSLQKLILSKCSSLKELPESIGDLKESLVELFLDRTRMKALPASVGLLKKMEVLDLLYCKSLVDLPKSLENMSSLRCIILWGNAKLRYIPKLPCALIELRLCNTLVRSKDVHEMNQLELLCLKKFSAKEEQFTRSIVRTSFDGLVQSGLEFICVHYSRLMHGLVRSFIFCYIYLP